MASLKDIRTRIASIETTKKVTSAMKMVSASKLRRAQEEIMRFRPYADKLSDILGNLSGSLQAANDNPYILKREEKKLLFVVVNSNRGLCGAFNGNVIKFTNQLLDREYKSQMAAGNVDFISIGKKAFEFFKKQDIPVQNESDLYANLDFEHVAPVVEGIMNAFIEGTYDKVIVIYNQFKNAATQNLVAEQLLPLIPAEVDAKESSVEYIYEPSKEQIVNDLLPKSIKIQFYKALLDSHAAEHGARMTAMHKATDNATDLLKDLNLVYNKARQASITNEILEIVSGAEALK